MLDKLLKNQEIKSKIKQFSSDGLIYDIVVYGSIVKGKEKINDLDIAIIINKNKSLNTKLKLAQEFRKLFSFLEIELDVKIIAFNDFMDKSFLARQAIISEGYSLLKNGYLSEQLGYKTYVFFDYNLTSLTNSQKKTFYYVLNGRRKDIGLLKKKGAIKISNNLIKIPIVNFYEFKELFKLHNISCLIKSLILSKND